MTREAYEPTGLDFFDLKRQRQMRFVQEGEWKDWICYKHPDGQWVSLRKATPDDLSRLFSAQLPA